MHRVTSVLSEFVGIGMDISGILWFISWSYFMVRSVALAKHNKLKLVWQTF